MKKWYAILILVFLSACNEEEEFDNSKVHVIGLLRKELVKLSPKHWIFPMGNNISQLYKEKTSLFPREYTKKDVTCIIPELPGRRNIVCLTSYTLIILI